MLLINTFRALERMPDFFFLFFLSHSHIHKKELAGDCWNVEKHKPLALSKGYNFSARAIECLMGYVILVFPHFNNRRLKVLWECGKVELFSRLFQVLW